jgi:serine/threonine protein kinase
VPLDRLLGSPMEIGEFLRLAIALSVALGRLHGRGLIHKDIKPTNIIVNSTTGQVWLTGFGIASRLPRERQSPEPPEFIAGTLPYMAPEQTGRMNRSIDSRSDLYGLGVTLYEMLTGSLPFTASDPMEWVHCHIARQPASPGERLTHVPAPLSAIILKLLSKTAEERYQTAAGLEADLRRCLVDWESRGRIVGANSSPETLCALSTVMVTDATSDRFIVRSDLAVGGKRSQFRLHLRGADKPLDARLRRVPPIPVVAAGWHNECERLRNPPSTYARGNFRRHISRE